MAVECEFQALMLAEAQEEIRAYEAQSHKPIQGRGWPKAMKPPSPGFVKVPIGLDYSLREFWQREERINSLTLMVIIMTKFQDRSPWTN